MTASPAEPLALFTRWYADAQECGLDEPTAVSLATASAQGRPSVRQVLLKGFSAEGFVFYTNLRSRKAHDLLENPWAALCFHWPPLERQVRLEGGVTQVADEEASAYFASRERASRIGAWASKQSQPMSDPLQLERRVVRFAARFGVSEVPRPEFWSGFRIAPRRFEFWEKRPFRLHKRFEFNLEEGEWRKQHLFP